MSSNTNIGNTPVNQGYVQLIHMGETGGIDGTLRALYDGDGTASDLLIASDKVKISTELYIGSKTLTEFVQDTVGAMFSSNTETNITVTYQDGDGTIDLVSSGEVTLTGSETLTNKTLTSPVINTGISGSAILDSDTMSGASATKLSSSESIKAYVDTEVAGIVSSAPSTLDTLNELAAALGDDANFATTTATSLGEKLVKSSNLSDLTNAGTARSNLGLGSVATLSSIAVSNLTASAIQISSESFADNDTTIMTSAAIQDKIQSFGYSTTTGTVTSVSVGTGLDVADASSTPSITLDLTELADMTEGVVSADELILLDGSTLKRKAISEITLSTFSDSGFNHGAITALNNATENELVTVGSTTTELDAEANLTFDGTDLKLLGDDLEMRWGAGQDFKIYVSSDDAYLVNVREDKDIRFMVNDGNGTSGANITALKIDASDAGTATFNHDIFLNKELSAIRFGASQQGSIYEHQSDIIISNSAAGNDTIFENLNSDSSEYVKNLFIDGSTSRIGIGTTSPSYKLDVHGVGRIYSASGDADLRIEGGASNTTSFMIRNGAGNNRVDFLTGGANAMTINSSQKVGIGTTSPSTKLQVVGHTSISGVGNALRFDTTGSTESNIIATINDYETLIATNRGSAGFGVIGNSDIRFGFGTNYNAAETDLYIKSDGSVGIGTTDPASYNNDGDDFVIAGTGATGMSIASGTSSNGSIMFADGTGGTAGYRGAIKYNHGSDYMHFNTAAAERMRLESDGDLHLTADVVAYSSTPSDIRLKENFTKIENGLDIVNKLEGHTFNWKKGGDRLSAGFKAQEVEKVLPHLVDEKKLPLKADDDKEYKILRYEEMIPYLVEAIKEQQKQIEELKNG